MKTLTMRDLNRRTADVLDAVECGETFELRRNGRAIGYLSQTPPAPKRTPDWSAHFDWLRKHPSATDANILAEFDEERQKQQTREQTLGNLK